VLHQLLNLLAAGGVRTPSELANLLGVSESLLNQMLADLTRMGYLRSVSGAACLNSPNGSPCADCPLTDTCAVSGPEGRVWVLTEKALPQK